MHGASAGEGLGNRFLAHIREVDAILHVLRCFEDENVAHVTDRIDPVGDAEVVETELMLADLESLERRLEPLYKRFRGGERTLAPQVALIEQVIARLSEGQTAQSLGFTGEEAKAFAELQLLTAKPVLYVCNVDEESAASGNPMSRQVEELAERRGAATVVISAGIEAELAQLEEAEERQVFLAELGLAEAGLDRMVRAGYRLLNLITFFSAGEKEARAWTITEGTTARAAAGLIHSDFARGFIAAETITHADYVAAGGEQGARDQGLMRLEGHDYRVRDGDVIRFRFNV